MSIDSTIEASMEASFFSLFAATLGTSVTTGYDWTEASESTKNEQITVEVKASVRPGYILQIKQATGKCGDNRSNTELFKIIQAKKLMHGKTSKIKSKKIGILKNLPNTFEATRYHSLIIDKKSLSSDLEITAETNDGLIMGVQHKKFNIHGVQFHPESIKTKLGIKILKNFIKI